MAALLNDGSVPFGAPSSITIATVVYVVEDCSPKDAAKKVDRFNELGEPSGRVLIQDFVEASLTLQLATSSTILPANGSTFTKDLLKAGSTQTWVVMSVGNPTKQDDAQKVEIEVYKKIN